MSRAGRFILALATVGVGVAGCSSATTPSTESTQSTSSATSVRVLDPEPYRQDVPALTTQVYLPAVEPSPVPVVVLVPGGGWTSADPSGMVPLAQALASQGLAAVTTTYRTSSDGAYFPTPDEDVACAVNAAVARVRDAGRTVGPVVVVGHSAGAQLAAVEALGGDRYQDGCASPRVRPDGLVGLAGPYDIEMAAVIAQSLFAQTPQEDPASWKAGNPMALARQRPHLPVLLIHGGSDSVVPVLFSQTFADALLNGGHPVDLDVLPGLGHLDVFEPGAVAAPIVDFARQLQSDAAAPG